MDTNNKYVFISYCTKNRKEADSVREIFIKKHIPCWMAPYDIPAGEKYAYVINDALENCSCFLLILSNDSQNSQFVDTEVERARTYRKPIITMQIEDVVLNSGFRFYIGSEQIVPVNNICEDSNEMKKITNSISTHLEIYDDTHIPPKKEPISENPYSGSKTLQVQTKTNSADVKNNKPKLGKLFFIVFVVIALVTSIILGTIMTKSEKDSGNATDGLETSEQMYLSDGNMINDGLVCEKDGVIYYQNHDDNWYLYKEENGVNIRLNKDNSWCICSDGEYVYYANVDDGSSIYRIKSNGEGREKLNSDNCSNLIIDGDYIYYIDSNSNRNIFRMKKDGSEKQRIVESYVYDAAIYGNRIYATSEENIFSVATDGSGFGVIRKEKGKDINLFGGNLFFINREDSKIYCMKTDGSEFTKISNDKAAYLNVYAMYIYYQNLSAEGRLFSIEITSGGKKQLTADDSRYINVTSDKIYYRIGKETQKIHTIPLSGTNNFDTLATTALETKSTTTIVESKLAISKFNAEKMSDSEGENNVEFSWYIYSDLYISDWILYYTIDNDDTTYWTVRCDDNCKNKYKYFESDSTVHSFANVEPGQTVHFYMRAIDTSGKKVTSGPIDIVM